MDARLAAQTEPATNVILVLRRRKAAAATLVNGIQLAVSPAQINSAYNANRTTSFLLVYVGLYFSDQHQQDQII